MDLKKEIKKLEKHRRGYYPAVSRLMGLYRSVRQEDLPVDLMHDRDALIILELIDVGYLDSDALIVTRRFDDISGLFFNGNYPLTESGEAFYRREGRTLKARLAGLLDTFRSRR